MHSHVAAVAFSIANKFAEIHPILFTRKKAFCGEFEKEVEEVKLFVNQLGNDEFILRWAIHSFLSATHP